MNEEIDDWLFDEVINGLQKLYVLRLRNSPAEDALKDVAGVWMEVLANVTTGWREQTDKPRVRRSFSALLASSVDWPSPRQFLDNLGPKPLPPAEETKARTPEQIAKNLQRIEELKAALNISVTGRANKFAPTNDA